MGGLVTGRPALIVGPASAMRGLYLCILPLKATDLLTRAAAIRHNLQTAITAAVRAQQQPRFVLVVADSSQNLFIDEGVLRKVASTAPRVGPIAAQPFQHRVRGGVATCEVIRVNDIGDV